MLSIPLDSQNATTISELYGNAPYFALLDETTGTFTTIENEKKGNGLKTVEFLQNSGANSTIFFHMGEGLYKAYQEKGIEVFTCKKEFISIDTIFEGAKKGNFTLLDAKNYKLYIDFGDCKNQCGCEA